MTDGAIVWGLLAGSAWSAANLWCLSRLLHAWLVPPPARPAEGGRLASGQTSLPATWRVVGWLIVKFLLVYVLAVWLLTRPGVSSLGFGAGFSLVLAAAVIVSLTRSIRTLHLHPTDGR